MTFGSGDERRRAERVVQRLSLATLADAAGAVEMETMDVSATGLSCLAVREIPLMARVKVTLGVPGEDGEPARPIEAEGIVVRVEKQDEPPRFKIALFFSHFEGDGRAILERAIESQRQRGREI